MARQIVHDESATTYQLVDDDGTVLSHADYRPQGPPEAPVMIFHHTFTVPRHRGNGYAEEVVRAALDDARARSARVVATCWFVDGFIRDHPAYADLVA